MSAASRRRWAALRDATRAVAGSWTGRIGAALVGIIVVSVLVSLVWVPYDPTRVVPSDKWLPISADHWFGTDGSGKDLFSQVLVGARTTLFASTVGQLTPEERRGLGEWLEKKRPLR